ncbi:MAG: hypothetical protein CVU07_00015 [Bacteroidetes bacterium HGW-Bacteroidetes-23]|nr:MAG: hypothetical protein CVU07_00015 [Bacteroidetes bacterium HGW-Bacteroidetes-23]
MKKNYSFLSICIFLFSLHGHAQVIDITFALNIANYDDARKIHFQQNGSLIIGGSAEESSGAIGPKKMAVARFLNNGTLDTTFGTNGVTQVYPNSTNYSISDLLNDDSGNLFMLGNYFNHCLIKMNSNGIIDTSFGNNGIIYYNDLGTSSSAQRLLLLPDGDILIFGFGQLAGFTKTMLILKKLNSDGSIDASFGTNGLVTIDAGFLNNSGLGCFLQSDGKIVVAGNYQYLDNGVTKRKLFLSRLSSSTGIIDSTYGTNGISFPTDIVNSFHHIEMDANDEITTLGRQSVFSTPTANMVYAKFDNTGSIISSETKIFSVPGTGTAAAIQPDGKMVFAGDYINVVEGNGSNCYFRRYNADGTIDLTFGTNGLHTVSFSTGNEDINKLKLGPDNKIYFAGHSRAFDFNWRMGRLTQSALNIEENQVDKLIFYPNPASEIISISGIQIKSYRIIDIQGRVILNDNPENNNLDISSLSKGTYIIEIINNEDKKFIQKFLKK